MSRTRRMGTHRQVATAGLLLVTVFAGCLTPIEEVPLFEGPLRAFTAVFEGDAFGLQRVDVEFSGPGRIRDATGGTSEAYTFEVRRERPHHGHWGGDHVVHDRFDGDLERVRRDSHRVSWSSSGWPPLGLLWPVLHVEHPEAMDPDVQVLQDRDGFRIMDRSRVYHYEWGEPVPFLMEARGGSQGTLHRTAYVAQGALPPIDAWPVPQNATGDRGLLFPGADQSWFTHPASYEEQFGGLMEHSESVRTMIESGGCVGRVVHDPPQRHERTVLGQPVGEGVVIHRTEFSVLAPAQSGSSQEDQERSADAFLSPGPSVEGERWRVTWSRDPLLEDPSSQQPLLEDEVEYERIARGYVGYMECNEVRALGRPVSLQDAWGRAESLPVEWDPERLRFSWQVGLSDHDMSVPERYRFEVLDVSGEGHAEREVDLRMDARKGAFMALSADADVLDSLDG